MANSTSLTRSKPHQKNKKYKTDILKDNQNIMSQFTKGLFWSYDIQKLDYIKNKDLIIKQVIEAGLERDEILMWKLYSYDDIKNIAINIEYLDAEIVTYMAFVLKIKEEEFRCYGKKPWYRKCIS